MYILSQPISSMFTNVWGGVHLPLQKFTIYGIIQQKMVLWIYYFRIYSVFLFIYLINFTYFLSFGYLFAYLFHCLNGWKTATTLLHK